MDAPLTITRTPGVPLYLSLAAALRDAIHAGRFQTAERLPASRALALALSVSRNTVVEAYEHLRAEGYITGRRGSGTTVAAGIAIDRVELPEAADPPVAAPAREKTLSAFGRRALAVEPGWPAPLGGTPEFDFRYGTPSLDDFPIATWRTLSRRVLDYPAPGLLGYGPPEGLPALREAIAHYLQRSRGVVCAPADVIVVNGSQQALDLATRCLLDPGDEAVVEEPCYPGARAVFAAAGARLTHVPCDSHGIEVRRLPPAARLAYVTPSHQFPSGAVLSASRRLELLEWARQTGAFVIEDDYCSEFRYDGRPLAALQGIDTSGSVVYVGTFSKLLLPGLRLGYMVAPPSVTAAIRSAKLLTDRHVPLLTQSVLALFMAEGHFERHLRRMRKVYRARRDALVAALDEHLAGRARVSGTASGIHLLVAVAAVADPAAFVQRAAELGVRVQDARPYYSGALAEATFIMGYSSIPLARIPEGVRRLASVLSRTAPQNSER